MVLVPVSFGLVALPGVSTWVVQNLDELAVGKVTAEHLIFASIWVLHGRLDRA